MYIFNYEYLTGHYPIHSCQEKTKKESVANIFKYLEKKQIPIIVPKIILNEIKKKMKELNYTYNKDIIYGKLNIIEDEDDSIEKEYKQLAQKIFYESSTDLIIYIYSKNEKIPIIITDNSRDFYEAEKRYNQNINENEMEIIILGIADIYKVIS